MTIQIKNTELMASPKMIEMAPSTLSEMSGKKREIEKIRIEDLPEKLDIELHRIESNRNRPLEQKLVVAIAAAMIVMLAGVCFGLAAPTLGSLALGMVIPGSIIETVSIAALMMIEPPRGKIPALRNCREDLQEKEFLTFAKAKKSLSEGLTLKEWLHVHYLYEKKKETERKIIELVDQLHWEHCW